MLISRGIISDLIARKIHLASGIFSNDHSARENRADEPR